MMDIDKIRAEFEKWASDDGAALRAIARSGDGYLLMQTHCDWISWQAVTAAQSARVAAQAVEIARLNGVIVAVVRDSRITAAQGALTDAQILAELSKAFHPPHAPGHELLQRVHPPILVQHVRAILSQSAAQGADDARDAARWRLIMRVAADGESPEAKSINAAMEECGPLPDNDAEAALMVEGLVDAVIASLAEVSV